MEIERPIELIVVLAFCVFWIILSYYVSRRAEVSAKQFLTAGGSIGAFVGGAALSSAYLSGSGMVGTQGVVIRLGVGTMLLVDVFLLMCMFLALFIIGPQLRRLGCSTMGEFFEERYGKKSKIMSSIIIVIIMYVYLQAQVLAGGLAIL